MLAYVRQILQYEEAKEYFEDLLPLIRRPLRRVLARKMYEPCFSNGYFKAHRKITDAVQRIALHQQP